MKLKEIVEELEKSDYTCTGGELKNNVAFVALKERVEANNGFEYFNCNINKNCELNSIENRPCQFLSQESGECTKK